MRFTTLPLRLGPSAKLRGQIASLNQRQILQQVWIQIVLDLLLLTTLRGPSDILDARITTRGKPRCQPCLWRNQGGKNARKISRQLPFYSSKHELNEGSDPGTPIPRVTTTGLRAQLANQQPPGHQVTKSPSQLVTKPTSHRDFSSVPPRSPTSPPPSPTPPSRSTVPNPRTRTPSEGSFPVKRATSQTRFSDSISQQPRPPEDGSNAQDLRQEQLSLEPPRSPLSAKRPWTGQPRPTQARSPPLG